MGSPDGDPGELAFLRRGETRVTARLAPQLLDDSHDPMHKAVGWMLRELGKQDDAALVAFLDRHARAMPRTMLRYATERRPDRTRGRYITLRRVISRRMRMKAR